MPEANREDIDKNLEAEDKVIDPRLDNRHGRQRPPLETFPAKPQQIDGPDVTDTVPRPEEMAKAEEKDRVTRKGMVSPGDHGLGDTEAVPFEEGLKKPETAESRAKSAAEEAKTKKDTK